MEKHEGQCRENPATKSCMTCRFNSFEPAATHDDPHSAGGYFCDGNHLEEGEKWKKGCQFWKLRKEVDEECAHVAKWGLP